MNNGIFGQSNITNILSISRNDWSLTPRENQLHSMTINCVLETINNTICVETYNLLHLQIIVYSKWPIINVNWQILVFDCLFGVWWCLSTTESRKICRKTTRLLFFSTLFALCYTVPDAGTSNGLSYSLFYIWSNLPSYKVEFRYQSEFPASSVKS